MSPRLCTACRICKRTALLSAAFIQALIGAGLSQLLLAALMGELGAKYEAPGALFAVLGMVAAQGVGVVATIVAAVRGKVLP